MAEAVFNTTSMEAVVAKEKLVSGFFRKGVTIGLLSGFSYGLYSAILALTMAGAKGKIGDYFRCLKTDYVSCYDLVYYKWSYFIHFIYVLVQR